MVFCYGDIWLENFIIDDQKSRVTVIDFSEANYLPSSFSKWLLLGSGKIRRNISSLVVIPSTEGIDNTEALRDAGAFMIQCSSSFNKFGLRLVSQWPGAQEHSDSLDRKYRSIDKVDKVVVDSQGRPVVTGADGVPLV